VKLHGEGYVADTAPHAGPGLSLPNVPASDPIVGSANNRLLSGTSPLMTPKGAVKKAPKGKVAAKKKNHR
jgi:hypothetical protein